MGETSFGDGDSQILEELLRRKLVYIFFINCTFARSLWSRLQLPQGRGVALADATFSTLERARCFRITQVQ